MGKYVVGVDLGGTKIYTACADFRGEIIAEAIFPTGAAEGPDKVIGRIVDTINKVRCEAGMGESPPVAIGIGSPGPLNPATGVVYNTPNLSGWLCVPLRERLSEATGVPVFLDNDANLAALGEHLYGAGRGSRNMVYVTVSTGIGGGLILNGKLFRGSGGGAGEVGHMVIVPDGPLCGCGRRGCLEALSSGTAMAEKARELVKAGRGKVILSEAGGNPGQITAISVSGAAALGDPEATEIISTAGKYLGMGLANIINILNPERIVLGGGALEAGKILWDNMERELSERSLGPAFEELKVVRAGLEGKAGLMGAVALAISSGIGNWELGIGG